MVDEEEDAVVPKDVKMRIGEAVKHCLSPSDLPSPEASKPIRVSATSHHSRFTLPSNSHLLEVYRFIASFFRLGILKIYVNDPRLLVTLEAHDTTAAARKFRALPCSHLLDGKTQSCGTWLEIIMSITLVVKHYVYHSYLLWNE